MSGTPSTGGSAPDPAPGSAGGPSRQPGQGPAPHPAPEPDQGLAPHPAPEPDQSLAPAGAAAAGPVRSRRRFGDRGAVALAAAGVVLVLVAGGVGVRAAGGSSGPAQPPPAPALATGADPTQPAPATRSRTDGSWGPVSGQSPVAAPTGRVAAGVTPTGIRIPAIGVDATSLIPLEIMPATGELEAPVDFGDTGWYAAGPVPGEPGPAVIAAHVDSKDGPAVFFRLRELKPGDVVSVPRSDGVTVQFTVTAVEQYPKDAFPTQKVHGPTPDRALRLITCGGSFDQAKRSYRDNVVVYAIRS